MSEDKITLSSEEKATDTKKTKIDTIVKKRSKVDLFDIVNYLVFIIIALVVLVPIWKVLVDSFNQVGVYQFKLIPTKFTVDGYRTILETKALYRPFINSIITTLVGTLAGLAVSTLGGYVLSQEELKGRSILAYFLLFTMIFSGGMIPEYLVMKKLHLVNSMWILVVKHAVNVYNIILMKNFFEGIPKSLHEAARIDGCSAMGIFLRIVLPLSKAALASIGLMYAVTVWNDYSTVKIYITDPDQVNFQYKLRNMVMDGDTPTTSYNVSQTTLYNAGIVMAILPFMVLYPFLQKYFVQGVNVGAVKE